MRKPFVALLTAMSLIATLVAAVAAPARAVEPPALVVTEIAADHPGVDNWLITIRGVVGV